MTLLRDEDREILLVEYKQLNDENWRRGNAIWLVNSILITGSVLIAFQSNVKDFPAPLASLLLVVIALILTATGNKVTRITYKRIEKIRKILGLPETTRIYHEEMEGKPWYLLRINAVYMLFIFLISTYLYLLLQDYYISLISLVFGFLLLIIKEVYLLSKRSK